MGLETGSYDRRGSVLSPSGWVDEHTIQNQTRSPSPDEIKLDREFEHKPARNNVNHNIPNIVIARHRTNTETQYADTEVIV